MLNRRQVEMATPAFSEGNAHARRGEMTSATWVRSRAAVAEKIASQQIYYESHGTIRVEREPLLTPLAGKAAASDENCLVLVEAQANTCLPRSATCGNNRSSVTSCE